MDPSDLIELAVIALSVVIGLGCVLYLARAVVLWYWRINEAIDLLRSIDFSLQQLPAVRQAKIAQAARRSRAA